MVRNMEIANFYKKIPLIDAYKKIDQPRRHFKKYFWWSVLIIILSTIGEVLSQGNAELGTINVLSKIVTAIATSVAAAALIEIFSGMREVWIKEQTQKEFRAFFGCELIDHSVAIVIPRFPMNELKKRFPEVLDMDLDSSGAVKRLREVSNMVLAYADVKTASDILIAFSKVNLLHLAEMVWDDDMLEKWIGGQASHIRTFIIIGLQSNRLFGAIRDAPHMSKFFRVTKDDGKFAFSIAKRSGNVLDWYPPRMETDKQDYVLLSKVEMSSSQKALIVGGITAQGTERIGEYLRENWKTIHNWSDSSSGSQVSVTDREFAMSISVPLPTGVLTPEEWYIDNR